MVHKEKREREREREIAMHGERGTLLLCVMHRDSSNMHVVFLFFRDIVIEETRLVDIHLAIAFFERRAEGSTE